MAYNPQSWVDGAAGGTPLSAARLTTMEAGIEDADSRITAEAAARAAALAALAPVATSGSATDLTTGTIPEARIPATIARDSEVTTATALLLAKASNLSDLASAATARTNLGLAAVAASGSATDLTTGTIADARIPSTIARDAEVAALVPGVALASFFASNRVAGTTDDAPAFAAAIAALPSTGGIVVWPSSEVRIATLVTIDRPVHIRGAHRDVSKLVVTGWRLIRISSSNVIWTDMTLEAVVGSTDGIKFFDNNVAATLSGGFRAWRFERVRFLRGQVVITSIGRTSQAIVYTTGTDFAADLSFVDCEFDAIRAPFALEVGGVDGVVIDRCWVHHCGIDITAGEGIKLAAGTTGARVTNTVSEFNSRDGIDIYDSVDTLVEGCVFRNNVALGIDMKWHSAAPSACQRHRILNNDVHDNGTGGIHASTHYTLVAGNIIKGNGGYGIRVGSCSDDANLPTFHTRIVNNTVLDNTQQGIYTSNATTDITIEGNEVHGNDNGGIDVSAQSLDTSVRNNKCFTNIPAGIIVRGGRTRLSGNRTQDVGNALIEATATDVQADVPVSAQPLTRFAWRLQQATALKIVAIGDSVLEGATVTADGGTLGVSDALSRLATTLDAASPATITTSNRAVSGRTAATAFSLGSVDSAIADAGDLYLIGFGHNDLRSDSTTPGTGYPKAAMARAVEKMIRRIRDELPGADIALVLENPHTSGSASNALLQAQNVLLRQLAAHYGLAVADAHAAFVSVGDYSTLLADGANPNGTGHQLIADTIRALIPATGAPTAPATPAGDKFGAARVARTWESKTAALATADTTQGGRYVFSGTWSSTTTAPHVTSTAASLVRVLCYGDEVLLRLDCGAGTGVVDIDVDENAAAYTLDLTTYPTGQRYIPLVGLGYGAHTIVIKHVSGTTTFRGFDVPARTGYSPVLDGPKVVRTGTWTTPASATGSPAGLLLTSTTLGDSVQATISGTGLALAHNVFSSNHLIEVQIDGGAWTSKTVNLATADGGSFRSTVIASGLPLGVHTIGVRSVGARATLTIYDITALDETTSGYRRDVELSRALRALA